LKTMPSMPTMEKQVDKWREESETGTYDHHRLKNVCHKDNKQQNHKRLWKLHRFHYEKQ